VDPFREEAMFCGPHIFLKWMVWVLSKANLEVFQAHGGVGKSKGLLKYLRLGNLYTTEIYCSQFWMLESPRSR
jgi:hypothetical protein